MSSDLTNIQLLELLELRFKIIEDKITKLELKLKFGVILN